MTTTVYKIGGSLLDLPDLALRLEAVLSQQTDDRPLLLAGGGPAADIVRQWDRIHRLGEGRAHWLALRSLMFNEALLLELLPEARLVTHRAAAEDAWKSGKRPLLCVYEFFRAEEANTQPASRLPHTWDATSDSVAAWIALRWPADRLVLFKSASLSGPHPADPPDRSRLVDACFPRLAAQLPDVRWINLRAEKPTSETWR